MDRVILSRKLVKLAKELIAAKPVPVGVVTPELYDLLDLLVINDKTMK